jgi:hypothetical protein
LATDRCLFFATGSRGWANVSDTHDGGVLGLFEEHTTLDGRTVGGGLGYACTDDLIGRIEYLPLAVTAGAHFLRKESMLTTRAPLAGGAGVNGTTGAPVGPAPGDFPSAGL